MPGGRVNVGAVRSSAGRWQCGLLAHATLPESQDSSEFRLPSGHPAWVEGTGAREEEVSDLAGVWRQDPEPQE